MPRRVCVVGALVEATFLRPVYRREELEQLLVTYALVLIISDAVKFIWGPDNRSVSRPAILAGSVDIGGRDFPTYNLLVLALGPLVALALWLLLSRTQFGRLIRAAANDREMVGVVGVDVSRLLRVLPRRMLAVSAGASRPSAPLPGGRRVIAESLCRGRCIGS